MCEETTCLSHNEATRMLQKLLIYFERGLLISWCAFDFEVSVRLCIPKASFQLKAEKHWWLFQINFSKAIFILYYISFVLNFVWFSSFFIWSSLLFKLVKYNVLHLSFIALSSILLSYHIYYFLQFLVHVC